MAKIISPHHMPGIVTVPPSVVHAYYAEKGVDLDAKIIAHIEGWAAAVPVGTMVTVDEMMVNPYGDCGCTFVFGFHSSKCKGSGHGMPLEIVSTHLFPLDGSPCAIKGVVGLKTFGPLAYTSLGTLQYVQKVA